MYGYAGASYDAEVKPVGGQEVLTGTAALTKQERAATITIDIPQDGKLEYTLRVLCDQNFFVNVPITKEQPGLKEVYPIFREGTWIGDGFPFFFDMPPDATAFTMRYKGRSWPQEYNLHDAAGEVVSSDVWIGSNDLTPRSQQVVVGARKRNGWSFAVYGYGRACLLGFGATPQLAGQKFWFAASKESLMRPWLHHDAGKP